MGLGLVGFEHQTAAFKPKTALAMPPKSSDVDQQNRQEQERDHIHHHLQKGLDRAQGLRV